MSQIIGQRRFDRFTLSQAAVGGSEPSDAIRAVNALLTALDGLKRHPNAMVLTTSNITEAIDLAFVDRADIKVRRMIRMILARSCGIFRLMPCRGALARSPATVGRAFIWHSYEHTGVPSA